MVPPRWCDGENTSRNKQHQAYVTRSNFEFHWMTGILVPSVSCSDPLNAQLYYYIMISAKGLVDPDFCLDMYLEVVTNSLSLASEESRFKLKSIS